MQSFQINGSSGDTNICVGETLDNLKQYVPIENTVIVTDTQVAALYGHRFPECKIIRMGQGEGNKNLATVEWIYKQLLDMGADRSTFIVGIGGGIVCDITGFVASTYMRGLDFGYVATTLLAQVDASVGGKTGVNYLDYKNMIGVIRQPAFVLCDLALLKTLPDREISSGFGEIVKHAAIADAEMFAYLENHSDLALQLDQVVIEKLISDSVKIKAAVVNQDELEAGERRILNFGHTFGHAIEKTTELSHGQAVSVGMCIAAQMSVAKNLIEPADVNRLSQLLNAMGLPVQTPVDVDSIWDALLKDKKRERKHIHFVLLERIGKAVVKQLPMKEVRSGLEFLKPQNGIEGHE